MTYKEEFQKLLETEYRILQSPSNIDYVVQIRKRRIILPFFGYLLFGKDNNKLTDELKYKWVKLIDNKNFGEAKNFIADNIKYRLDKNVGNWKEVHLHINDFNNYF